MRAQISLDLLFAFVLVTLTVLNLIYLSNSEIAHAESFDVMAKVRVFSAEIVDHTAKLYAVGEGYSLKEEPPQIEGAEFNITFNGAENKIIVNVTVSGKSYWVVKNSTVPIANASIVVESNDTFWIKTVKVGDMLYANITSSDSN
ncbi:hypothetical protein OCC_01554 [Thermococcus litoralis DSM 5473]|uniref:Class III signal peptide-containing protein n=1 Tax=Thermococcus litoralis (strain ATCC 51850 / DSM 5473 / JCM 8560 / NS-C) TaxID=523849 RepID=H3ZLN6_THELN|nr:hypothetical protein [Thermococcus litoralis]EHR79174.1 hypothetical protein OCC_01554 [Thermococcus litoralis DSM 5473]